MDFLKDPKNQPIVVAVLIVVILGAVGGVIYMNSSGGGGGGAPTAQPGMNATPPGGPPGAQSAGMPPGAPGMPPAGAPVPGAAPAGAPASAPAASPAVPGTKPVAVAKLEEHRDDPFLPFGWRPPIETPPVIRIPMPGRLFPPKVKELPGSEPPEPPQPPRRMAGILFKDRVYAILESSGPAGASTMVVKPGDITDDGMRVERIEPTKIILATTNTKKIRRVEVQMAPSQRQPETPAGAQPGGPAGSPYMPYGAPPGPRRPYGPHPAGPMDAAPM